MASPRANEYLIPWKPYVLIDIFCVIPGSSG